MTTKHTPEPWIADGNVIWDNTPKKLSIMKSQRFPSTEADACIARAAQCVNALAGIPVPDEALKLARTALEAMIYRVDQYNALGGDVVAPDALKQARRALAALNPNKES